MNKKVKIILIVISCLVLVAAGIFVYFALTGKTQKNPPVNPVNRAECSQTVREAVCQSSQGLYEYISKDNTENFVVSPLSLDSAMAMAVLGASGNTQKQLLDFYGFADFDEFYSYIAAAQDCLFDNNGKYLKLSNSIWYNNDQPGNFLESYRQGVLECFGGEAVAMPSSKMQKAINKWVSQNTNNLIPELLKNPVDHDTVSILVNTLSLKDAWQDSFTNIGNDEFVTAKNKRVQKEYMSLTERLAYTEKDGTQLVSIPTRNGLQMAFILGECGDPFSLLEKAEMESVHVTIPKFTVESSHSKEILLGYYNRYGSLDAFVRGVADFSNMVDAETFPQSIFISDIQQDAKLIVEEEGICGAAATAVTGKNAAAAPARDPKEFLANKPFSFFVYAEQNDIYIPLFYGKINQ